jgi:hypothetical protein
MVWKGIHVHDVMQQAGFCAAGRGKFSRKDDFGWSGSGSLCMMLFIGPVFVLRAV